MVLCEWVWFNCKARKITEATQKGGEENNGVPRECSVGQSPSVLAELTAVREGQMDRGPYNERPLSHL